MPVADIGAMIHRVNLPVFQRHSQV